MNETYLFHHGIKGQKWGVRRYQNEDGSLTTSGKKRYSEDGSKRTANKSKKKKRLTKSQKIILATGAIAVTATLAYLGHERYSNAIQSMALDDIREKFNSAIDKVGNEIVASKQSSDAATAIAGHFARKLDINDPDSFDKSARSLTEGIRSTVKYHNAKVDAANMISEHDKKHDKLLSGGVKAAKEYLSSQGKSTKGWLTYGGQYSIRRGADDLRNGVIGKYSLRENKAYGSPEKRSILEALDENRRRLANYASVI